MEYILVGLALVVATFMVRVVRETISVRRERKHWRDRLSRSQRE